MSLFNPPIVLTIKAAALDFEITLHHKSSIHSFFSTGPKFANAFFCLYSTSESPDEYSFVLFIFVVSGPSFFTLFFFLRSPKIDFFSDLSFAFGFSLLVLVTFFEEVLLELSSAESASSLNSFIFLFLTGIRSPAEEETQVCLGMFLNLSENMDP